MVKWHHRLNGHEFEQTPGEGQGSRACYSPWGHKESDLTEWLKNKWLKFEARDTHTHTHTHTHAHAHAHAHTYTQIQEVLSR